MSSPRRTRADAKAATREALLRAADEVFGEKGFAAASVEEIAERAGFTRGAFYANFTDKADALLTRFAETRAAEMAEVAGLIATTPDDEKLAALEGWYGRMSGNDRLQRALRELSAQPGHADAVRARLAQLQADTRAVIAASLRGYREAYGVDLPVADEVIAGWILALGDGIASQRHVDASSVPDDAFSSAVAHLWAGLTR